jgi:hypothetical protein
MGTGPYKCQCQAGKYFNNEKGHYKCEPLLEINESCSQMDSCKNGICMESKCQCLPLQYFDQISGKCQNQTNPTSSSLVPSNLTSITTSSYTSISTTIITSIRLISLFSYLFFISFI